VRALRVVLVDDHALVRSAVRQALSAPDIEVVAEAANATEALTAITEHRPDVVLLDVDLPGVDGLNLLRELAPRLPQTMFVMLTVSSSSRDLTEAMRNGAIGYLTKDLTPDALQRAVRGLSRGELAMSRSMAASVIQGMSRAARRELDGGPGASLGPLSPREEEILRLLADGLTDREIAERLVISPRTVETHVSNILHKLDVRNRAQAARQYREARGG
jgi:two-component system, NarL family, nitrate/nitrite response regulator NarL